jgi:hypothetical protein
MFFIQQGTTLSICIKHTDINIKISIDTSIFYYCVGEGTLEYLQEFLQDTSFLRTGR